MRGVNGRGQVSNSNNGRSASLSSCSNVLTLLATPLDVSLGVFVELGDTREVRIFRIDVVGEPNVSREVCIVCSGRSGE